MKKLLVLMAVSMAAGMSHAVEGVYGDLFPYENKHSSFTVEVDAGKLDRFSIQTVFSTPTVANVPFTNAAVDVANNTIYAPSHGLGNAQQVHLATAPATAPSPLTTGTTYFAVVISDNLIQLATTYAQAVAGDEIDLLTAGSGSWTLRQTALSLGSSGYVWTGSNDRTNWTTVTASSQALTSMALGTRLHDFGEYAYRYLRFTFNGPASGVIRLRAYLNGKRRE